MEASGEFEAGDAVTIRSASGADVARGLTAYGSAEVLRLRGLHSREIARVLGYESGAEVIHHDDMVLL
jgi:glutamate 5-kinase